MKFISFGCWNKGDPDDQSLPLYHLLESLKSRLSIRDIDSLYQYGILRQIPHT